MLHVYGMLASLLLANILMIITTVRLPALMSPLKLEIFCQPAFSRWKLAQRRSSSSGDSFIRSSRVSPSRSRAAKAGAGAAGGHSYTLMAENTKPKHKRLAREQALKCERTFVPAEFDVGKQADLDDLPEQAQHQVGFALLQVQSSDVHHMTPDGRGRVQSQVQVLLPNTTEHRGGVRRTPSGGGHWRLMYALIVCCTSWHLRSILIVCCRSWHLMYALIV